MDMEGYGRRHRRHGSCSAHNYFCGGCLQPLSALKILVSNLRSPFPPFSNSTLY